MDNLTNTTTRWSSYIDVDDLLVSDEREERDDEAMEGLVQSIKAVGILQPLVVTQEGDRYRVVCGRRRLKAAKLAGLQAVPVSVSTMDDVAKEIAFISENATRMELTSEERDAAILRLAQLYEGLHPDLNKRLKDQISINLNISDEDRANAKSLPKLESIPTVVAKAFGIDKQTAIKALRRARSFTEDQRKFLKMANVGDDDMAELAKEDQKTVNDVLKMIGAGFSFDESMRDIFEEQGRVYKKAPPKKVAPEDYLGRLPGRRYINDPEIFDSDALLFRELQDEVKIFKKKINWDFIKGRMTRDGYGLYVRRLLLALDAADPTHWVPCKCQSMGRGAEKNCNACRSGAYQIGQ